MKLNVRHVPLGEVKEATFCERFSDQSYYAQDIHFTDDVNVSVRYSFDGEAYIIMGDITAAYEQSCARCANAFVNKITIPFKNRFTKAGAFNADEDSADDDESYSFTGESIDIETMVLDEIFLQIPMVSTCSDDCKGLCPNCGCNWNNSQCDCVGEEVSEGADEKSDNPFSKLSQLLDNGKEV